MSTGHKIITSVRDFEQIKVKLSVPFKYDNKTIINIIVGNFEPLLIQTPICTVPYRYKLYDDNYFQIDLIHQDDKFKELIDTIINQVCKKVPIKCPNVFEQAFKLKNCDVSTIQVFDGNKNKIDIKSISKHDVVKAIFQIDHVIIQEENISFGFKVIQIMKCNPNVNQSSCLFDQGDTERFQKMLSVGVPLEAIRHKMNMENIPSFQIENMITKYAAPPLQPPPLINIQPQPITKILKTVDMTRKVPSLNEIMQAKAKLKNSLNFKNNIN